MAKAKTLASFKDAHDPDLIATRKITQALDDLAKDGPESWEYDSDFRARTGLTPAAMEKHADKFKDHHVTVRNPNAHGGKRRVWVATTKAAVEFRKVAGL